MINSKYKASLQTLLVMTSIKTLVNNKISVLPKEIRKKCTSFITSELEHNNIADKTLIPTRKDYSINNEVLIDLALKATELSNEFLKKKKEEERKNVSTEYGLIHNAFWDLRNILFELRLNKK